MEQLGSREVDSQEFRRDQEQGGAGGLSRESRRDEIKNREVELGSHSWIIGLDAELFRNSSSLCDFVPHSCRKSKSQFALHS